MRYEGFPWNHLGPVTRSMSKTIENCVCKRPIFWIGSVVFKRSNDDNFHIENGEWDVEKLGNPKFPVCDNLDQLLTLIWREIPIYVTKSKKFESAGNQVFHEHKTYFFKEMFFCQNEMCDEVISWDPTETTCAFC